MAYGTASSLAQWLMTVHGSAWDEYVTHIRLHYPNNYDAWTHGVYDELDALAPTLAEFTKQNYPEIWVEWRMTQ